MDASGVAGSAGFDLEILRLQAEEHPLIEDTPPTTPGDHCQRLMHLRAYDEAVLRATGRDVLDVGCNTGYGTVRFVPVARRVVGVDVSRGAIDLALKRASGGQPEFVHTSGLSLPFSDRSFDLVSIFQVLEHVPDPVAYLREMARVTRPGGEVVLATPNAAIRLDPGMAPWNRFHVREYLAVELRELLEQVFPEVRVRGLFGTPTLYETEIRRVDAARRRIRRKDEAARQAEARAEARETASKGISAMATGAARPLPIRIARRVLPRAVRGWLRSMVAPRSAPTSPSEPVTAAVMAPPPDASQMAFERFLEFTVADLFYADRDLDRAMDLLAICRVGERSGTA